MLAPLPSARTLLADAAYDSNTFKAFPESRETTPLIKQNLTRKNLHLFDIEAYKGRNIIERAFSRLKYWRRVATRYDKLARNFTATVIHAILAIWRTSLSLEPSLAQTLRG